MSDIEKLQQENRQLRTALDEERLRYDELFLAYHETCAKGALARREVDLALPVMREYARSNPPHEYEGRMQDPNGVHAWLARNDRA